jgi:hypothetical protein
MAQPFLWLEALAGLKALYDLVRSGADYTKSLNSHRNERATIREAERASNTLSTYSEKEVQEIIKKIEGCRDRFISQGSGRDRTRCLCSIFEELMAGNGGTLPQIDAWHEMYSQLRCGK